MVISKKILDNFNYVYMCVSMCVSARVGACGGQAVLSYLLWTLGIKFGSSVRAAAALSHLSRPCAGWFHVTT